MDVTTDYPAVVMRGGTSRGLVLDGRDLPVDPVGREEVVAAMFGAGSPGQIDGLGGGLAHTSKVAVVQPSGVEGADVDYLFGQVSTTEAEVDFSGTCGNMASAVALFAVEEGMVSPDTPPGFVRIREAGSGAVLTCEVLPPGDRLPEAAGLPGTGSPVLLDLAGMQGASAGAMLPTGKVRQPLTVPGHEGEIPCSIVDIGNVLAFVPASALGLTGQEAPEAIEGTPTMDTLAQIRGAVAVTLGWADTPDEWLRKPGRLPFVALVSTPREGDAHLTVRLYAVGRIHRSIAVTAAAACGAGAAIEGSVVQDVLSRPFSELAAATAPGSDIQLLVAHPAGATEIGVRVGAAAEGGPTLPTSLRYLRTARRLMQGTLSVQMDIREPVATA